MRLKEIKVNGVIVPNEDKWIYDWFEMDATCPADIEKGLEEAAGDDVTLVINSPGGEIGSGSSMWYAINNYRGNTTSDIVGYACSAASYLAMGSDKVRMTPSALMMIHCVSGGISGNHKALEKEAQVLQVADKAISNVYRLRTGKSTDEILEMMEKETWMEADRALELGFIDEIIGVSDSDTDSATKIVLQNSLSVGTLLSEEVKQKIRNMVKHPESLTNQDFLLQQKLNLLKLRGGMKNEI